MPQKIKESRFKVASFKRFIISKVSCRREMLYGSKYSKLDQVRYMEYNL